MQIAHITASSRPDFTVVHSFRPNTSQHCDRLRHKCLRSMSWCGRPMLVRPMTLLTRLLLRAPAPASSAGLQQLSTLGVACDLHCRSAPNTQRACLLMTRAAVEQAAIRPEAPDTNTGLGTLRSKVVCLADLPR